MSVTCLEDRVAPLEAKPLEVLLGEFKTYHFAIVDLVEEETLG